MRNNKKRFLGALAVAGMIAASGSAFTNSNTLPNNNTGTVGYGATTVTGVTVSNVAYTADTTDGSKLKTVVVTSTDLTNAPGTTGTLTLRDGTSPTPVVLATQDCGTAVADASPATKYTYTCTLSTSVDAASVITVGFTATGNSA